ncbi:quinone-dependent dihydroorotate dehydrogenase [uncultured Abyssibacter sp.]|uniref:quinone-dependent dihydroorotate dehydrogenase n=1 Tax=uncultured Abyssibacter sp. TaxID=2320202 RepID=UPI0032B1FA93
MYQLARPALFAMDAESAHRFTLGALRRAPWLLSAFPEAGEDPVEVMGLRFRNRLGLAAGLDKNAECIDAWTRLGFGLIEIGTVTPKPQPGNPRPRMFRLPEHGAIINRLGFNNAGLDVVLDNIRGSDRGGARLGINLGKNAVTPAEHALDDYREGMQRAYELADYLTVNISSPNTVGLRDLQAGQARDALLRGLADCREMLAQQHGRRVPVAIKIAPDLEPDEVRTLGDAVVNVGFEALIATNTTIHRDAVAGHRYAGEAGGLSGDPVREPSTRLLRLLREHLGSACALIGVGGVMRPEHAVEKLRAGADLVQIYTGFIYAGPALVARSVDVMRQAGFTQVKP